MIQESIRLIKDWLAEDLLDSSSNPQGVNTKLALMDSGGLIDIGDTIPTDVAFFGDKSRDIEVALRRDPPSVPAVYVMEDSPFEAEGEPMTSAAQRVDVGNMAVAIRYLVKQWDTHEAFEDTYYTLRAITMSIRELGLPANDGQRVRNQVCIQAINTINQLLVNERVGDHMVTGAVVLDLTVRDAKPLG